MLKAKKGITLIALIITIVVLLVLTAVTINMVLGENGIFSKTKASVGKYKEASLLEETRLALIELQLEMLTDKTVNASNVADYVVQKNGVAVGTGQIYEDEGKYLYENNKGEKVQLINNNGELKIDKTLNEEKPSTIGRVMYHANGGSGNLPNSLDVAYGQQVIVDTTITPTRENYNFAGWALETDATTPITEFTMPDRNVTLYAVWTGIPVAGISLNKTSITLNIGETENLTATISPENAENKGVTWSTSDGSIATVENGVVTAVVSGEATITATSQGDTSKTATCTVTVANSVSTGSISWGCSDGYKNLTIPDGISIVRITASALWYDDPDTEERGGAIIIGRDYISEWVDEYIPSTIFSVTKYIKVSPGKTYHLCCYFDSATISWSPEINERTPDVIDL